MNSATPHNKFLASTLLAAGLASIGLIGGLGIQSVRGQLINFTPLLIALPAMNAMVGDYAILITAHLGDPETSRYRVRKLLQSLLLSLPISIVGVSGLSLFIARQQDYELSRAQAEEYVLLISVSLVAVLVITLVSVFFINRLLRRHRLNSDDVLIPIANTLASVMVLISFTIIAMRMN